MSCETQNCGKKKNRILNELQTFPDHNRSTEADSLRYDPWEKIILSLSRIVGAIGIAVGAVLGSVAALAVVGILVRWTCRKYRRNRRGTEGKCCIHVMLSKEQ